MLTTGAAASAAKMIDGRRINATLMTAERRCRRRRPRRIQTEAEQAESSWARVMNDLSALCAHRPTQSHRLQVGVVLQLLPQLTYCTCVLSKHRHDVSLYEARTSDVDPGETRRAIAPLQ